ncbi:MAG: ZIP family metal transporter [bacterium]
MPLLLLALATFVSTLLGGWFSLKYKDKLHLIMGFSAGIILGVVSFDIFPEIIEQVKINDFNPTEIMTALVVGFLLFHILEKTILIHHAHESDYASHQHPKVGVLSALALIGHSFMDGLGIGLGFQINPAIGLLVAIAVISHDFTDGMNTVALMLNHRNTAKKTRWFLLFDALAPILGAASTLFFALPDRWLVLYLGFFAGFLLYIGASDILPEAHRQKSSYQTIALTILGVAFIFFISRLI